MSRSYRKQPFRVNCGNNVSAKQDKMYAHRGVRRTQDRILKYAWTRDQLEDLLLPAMRECPDNDVWCWTRDGGHYWAAPDARDWSNHVEALRGEGWKAEYYSEWPPQDFVQLMRK